MPRKTKFRVPAAIIPSRQDRPWKRPLGALIGLAALAGCLALACCLIPAKPLQGAAALQAIREAPPEKLAPPPEGKVLVETWDYPAQDIPDDCPALFSQCPDLVRRSSDFDIERRVLSSRHSLTRVRAYLRPERSGAYRFAYAGDPHARLFLQESGAPPQLLLKADAGSRLKTWDRKDQVSEGVRLAAGKTYLIELLAGRRWPDPRPFELSWEGPGFARRTLSGPELQVFPAPDYKPTFRADTVNVLCGREIRFSPLANDSIQGGVPDLLGAGPSRLGTFRIEGGHLVFSAGAEAGREELLCRFRHSGREFTSKLVLVTSPELRDAELRRQLLDGIVRLPADLAKGRRLLPAGPQTAALFDLKNGRSGSSREATVVLAHWGRGRMAAMPAWMLEDEGRWRDQSRRLFERLLGWMKPGAPNLVRSPTASAWPPGGESWRRRIDEADLLVVHERDLQAGDLEVLSRACCSGKGLLLGVESERPSPASSLLAQAGILAYGWVEGSYEAGRSTPLFQGGELLQKLLGKEELPVERHLAMMVDGHALDQALIAGWTAADAQFRLCDADLIAYNQTLNLTPSLQRRLSGKMAQYLIQRESEALKQGDLGEVRAHRSALQPGSALYVPLQTPPLESQKVEIDTAMSGYIPTGCYALAGREVLVKVPSRIAGQGLILRIGDYGGGAGENPARMGGQQRDFTVKDELTRVVSPFGGLIYFYSEVSRISPEQRGVAPFTAEICGAIAAPLFILGKTSPEEWRTRIRHLPGPQAELWGPCFAATLPASKIRDFDDPSESLAYWGEWVKVYDRVNGCPERRNTPERVVLDVEPGAWAGYPFHGAHDWFKVYFACPGASRDLISSAGFPHELAHQAQSRPDHSWGRNPYTKNFEQTITIFDGAGTRALGIRPQRNGWVSSRPYADESMRQMLRAAEGASNPASHGGENLFPAFAEGELYVFLGHVFGDSIWPKFFADYARDEERMPHRLPKNDAEKRDQWLIRFSRISGYDMREFFVERLKLPVSPSALAELKSLRLPVFRPALGGVSEAATLPGVPVEIDLGSTGLSFDGICRIGKVSISGGQLVPSAPGIWTFVPAPGFSGVAEGGYESVSSSGFLHRNRLKVYVSPGGVEVSLYPRGAAEHPDACATLAPLHRGFCDQFRSPWRMGGGHLVRLSGLLQAELGGGYEFACTHSSTARIWIAEEGQPLPPQPVLISRGWRGPERHGGEAFKLELQAGRKYRVEVLMDQQPPDAASSKLFKGGWSEDFIALYWTPPAQTGLFPIEAPQLKLLQTPDRIRLLPMQTLR
ncbi:MAG: hypothetical protein RL095_2221 [Verrucomicrobiota bacterium]|jgi:hypothetical protein